jgi:murein L,D-transpeptidase YcbB/YkuD
VLSDAFLVYASHLAEGKVNGETLQPEWHVKLDSLDYANIIEDALRSNRIGESLRGLLPQHAFYSDLRRMLSSFEALARKGGWEAVPGGPAMKIGELGKRVAALRHRLAASGDLIRRHQKAGDAFDSTLADAVRRFQKRHGLEASGIVDSTTRAAMNVPVEERLGQIRANLERWRWLPRTLSRKYVAVNVAAFRLTAVEKGRTVLSMKVVVGNPDWQTPVFSSTLTQVLFNDSWLAPQNILETELINYMKADSDYLRRNKMVLLRGAGDGLREIDPRSIDLVTLNPKDIDFRLRQDPGPDNIMGQVKFLLPNKYEVFLHDTPYREDFAKTIRMYSHGCIRLERPYDFAEYLLNDYPGWTRDTILRVVQKVERRTITLKEPVPIYILYCTAWREGDGMIEFREDYYGRDKRLNAALLEGPRALSGRSRLEEQREREP